MKKPYLSLIIPTHKRAKLLARALSSVNIQKYREEIEVIVISDDEDYNTLLVCHEYLNKNDIFIRRNGLNGPSASRNIGLYLASGEHLMFLDDDDSWSSDFFQHLLNSKLNVKANYFNCNVVKERRLESGPVKLSENMLDLTGRLDLNVFVKNQIHMSCLIFNSSLVKKFSFDCSMRAYEDWDFLLNIYK